MIDFSFGRRQRIYDRIPTSGALVYSADRFLSRMIEDTLQKLGIDLIFTSGDPDETLSLFDENQLDRVFVDVRHESIRPGAVLRQLGYVPGYHLDKMTLYFIGDSKSFALPKELQDKSRFIALPISSSQMLLRLANDLLPEKSATLRKLQRKGCRREDRDKIGYYTAVLDQLAADVVDLCRNASDPERVYRDGALHVQQCLIAFGDNALATQIREYFRSSKHLKRMERLQPL